MKDSKVIILILVVVGVILLVLWLNSCEKYSFHSFPGPRSNYHTPGHSIHVGTGNFDWSKVSGYEDCMKMLINQRLPRREADTMCTPYLSDPEAEEFPF